MYLKIAEIGEGGRQIKYDIHISMDISGFIV